MEVKTSDEGQSLRVEEIEENEEEKEDDIVVDTTLSENGPQKAVDKWREGRQTSGQMLRFELCCDLTVVLGAAIGGWACFAWITGLQAPDVHDIALYEGVFCIQYILLLGMWFAQRFLDDWNFVQMKPILLNATKNLLDVGMNLFLRLAIWMAVVTSIVFSAFNLRIIRLHSITNVIISFCALSNFVVLLHLSSFIIHDAMNYVNALSDSASGKNGPKRALPVRITLGWWMLLIKTVVWFCRTGHMALHLIPLADSILLTSLMALIVYLSRRTVDSHWEEFEQLQHARLVARDSRLLIWPSVVLFASFLFEVSKSVAKLSHEYALRFLVTMSNIGTEDKVPITSEELLKVAKKSS